MKTYFPIPVEGVFRLSIFLFLLVCSFSISAQENPNCPDNPDWPGCLPPGGVGTFQVLLVLDESGSMGPIVSQVRSTVNSFASTLRNNATGTGEFELGIVEFNNTASVGLTLTDVRSGSFITQVNTYLNSQYRPSLYTNYIAALTEVRNNFTDIEIIFFISDGTPNRGGGSWQAIADELKCDGTYIFGIALGNNLNVNNIRALSGPDRLNSPLSLAQGADWLQEDIAGLAVALVDLANSLVDSEDPLVDCPDDIIQGNDDRDCSAEIFFSPTAVDNCTAAPAVLSVPASGSNFAVGTTTVTCTATDEVGNTDECSFTVTVNDDEDPEINCGPVRIVNNDPGVCGATVNIAVTATDNCTATPAIVCTPASGSLFSVGTTTVNCTATDDAGNTDLCITTVIVLDKEPPGVTCPADATVDAGRPTTPADTGTPATSDNCGVDQVNHRDRITPGSCIGELTIIRRWDVFDAAGNQSTCVQNINVIDTIPPALNMPADVQVECDTSAATNGMATATDAGDPNPAISYRDTLVSGHCDYKCTVHRIWTAIDDCNNRRDQVQVIEKDITPLIEEAITFEGEEAIFIGLHESRNPTSFRVKAEEAECVVQWLPDVNGRPTALRGGFQGVEGRNADPASCKPGSNPVDAATGRLDNPLFAEGLKLALYLRLNPDFNEVLLSSFGCEIDYITFTGLGPSGNIRSFMKAANAALGNQNMTPHERSWLKAFRCINGTIDLCD